VTAGLGDGRDEKIPQFLRDLGKGLGGKRPQLLGGLDVVEILVWQFFILANKIPAFPSACRERRGDGGPLRPIKQIRGSDSDKSPHENLNGRVPQ
jgi:hypothetical protein